MTDLGSTVNARYVYSKFSCHLCSSLGNPAPVTKQARMAMATMLIGSLEWSCSYPLIWALLGVSFMAGLCGREVSGLIWWRNDETDSL